jgi:hypothetical protein
LCGADAYKNDGVAGEDMLLNGHCCSLLSGFQQRAETFM